MGCGHSSPSPPVSCTVLKRKSTTRLFTVPNFSEWARARAGTALHFEPFYFRDLGWKLKVYPAGFSDADGAGDFVAVFVDGEYDFSASSTKISIEILDARRESAVFDGRTAVSEQTLLDAHDDTRFRRDKGYVRFVGRKELEASRCICADGTFTVRCTVSVDLEVTKPLGSAAAFPTTGVTTTARCASRSPPPPLPLYCTWRKTRSTTHLFAVTEFSSRCAGMPAGHALNFKRFWFRGGSWRLMLYPSGINHGDGVAIFVASGMWMRLKDTRMSIEILDVSGERAVFDGRTARSGLTTVKYNSGSFCPCTQYRKGYVRFVGRKELEVSDCVHGDCFTVRCTLSADEVVTKWLTITGTSPPSSLLSDFAKEGRVKNKHHS